ncbi:MAG TPA: radical SAM family heme chaperone HemW [Candidatus Eisenbacteria bacterium]
MLKTAPGSPPGRATPADLEGPCREARDQARLGLYVHVPFCAVRCAYCDFSSGSLSAAKVERYFEALEREVSRWAPAAQGRAFTSVFFGGGTPSALAARHFARLWRLLEDHFEIASGAEVTLEANPESVRPALLEAWAGAGVNRLSMGVQSFHPVELARLGRVHDAARPGQAMALARAHGFRRVSLDLMFGFPGHTERSFGETVEVALALEPEHLSAYAFIPEPGTPLGDAVHRREVPASPPELEADLYHGLTERLAAAGYGCYETSNFCRPNEECRHNLVYWLRREYVGLGPSAHGLWRGARYGNRYAMEAWADALANGRECADFETESERSSADEIVMLGLRLSSGLDARDHDDRLWRGVIGRYGAALARAVASGRLEATRFGFRIAACHRFVADDVIAWLMASAERGHRGALGFDRS